MKRLFSYLLLLSVISCQSQSNSITRVNADDFQTGIQKNIVQVLDVRTAKEYKSGHILQALQADWTNKEQFFDRIQYLDKKKSVYIYCLVGGRSAAAATWMRANGYSDVVELAGGINAWKSAGKPLEGSGNEKQMTMEEYLSSIPSDKTVLVDFGAPWCPPCVKMEPVIKEIQNDKSLHFLFVKMDAGVQLDIMKALQIEPIPVFIIYKNGKEIWRKQGLVDKQEFIDLLK